MGQVYKARRTNNDIENTEWLPITIAKAVEELEDRNFWATGTTFDLLQNGRILYTPTHYYTIKGAQNGLGSINGSLSLEEEFQNEIHRNLLKCSQDATPHVYTKIKTIKGYQEIQQKVAKMMLNDSVSAGAAIAIIDSEEL